MPELDDVSFWMLIRQALLLLVDAIERKLCLSRRTSELRKETKEGR
jgi:hypothetical protein